MKSRLFMTNASATFVPARFLDETEKTDGEVVVRPIYKQTILGYGGAFTDSSASLYAKLDEKTKKEFIRLYFSKEGLGYNLGRVAIGSCDFSTGMYDYAENDDLSDFSLSHDEKAIIPMIKDALKETSLSLLASCWSPLAKWKDSKDKDHGGHLLKEHYPDHAEYMAKFVKGYRALGLPVVAMTIQNEPAATQTWESCLYSPEEEAEMALLLKKRLPDTNIYIWDHNRDIMLDRVNGSLSVPNAKEAIYGVAYHWYDGDKNAEIAKVKEAYPDLHILFTEGCVELLNLNKDDPSSAIGTFENGRRYAENYIRDLNYGSEGFLDWNLLLDMNGGPNRVGNYCEAPILTDGESLHPTYSYYFIKHLSSFLRPGAKVMEVEAPKGVLAVAGKNQDGSLALVLLNLKETKTLRLSLGKWEERIRLEQNEIISIEVGGEHLW